MSETLEIIIKAKETASGVIKKTAGAVGDLSGKMKGAGPAANKLSKNLKNIGTAAATTSNKLKGISGKLLNLKTGIAGVATAAVFKQSVSGFAGFEAALTDMGKVTSESMESIKEKILALPPALGNSTALVKGYYQTISAGVTDPKKALETLTTASKAAKAAHVDQSEVIKGLTKVMAGYEGKIKTTSDAADLLFTIEKVGQTSFQELIPVIGGLAKMSNDLGVSQDELGASLAQITQTAGSTSEAATQYQAVLTGLINPTEDMQQALADMGYESAQAAIEQLGLAGVLKNLKEQTGGSAEKMSALFGRVEALKGMSALASNNFGDLGQKLDEMGKKTGALDRAWKDYQKTLNAIWDTFKNSVGKIAIEIGEKIAPTVKKALKDLSDYMTESKDKIVAAFKILIQVLAGLATVAGVFVSLFMNLFDALGPLGPIVVSLAGTFIVLLPVLGAIGFALSGLIQGFGLFSTALAGISVTSIPGFLGGIQALSAEFGILKAATFSLGSALAVAAGSVAAFFAGWQIGKIISASDAFGLLPITVGEAVQVAYSYLDAFFTRVKIGYLGIKKAIKDTFGFDTSAIDAQIAAENRHLDVVQRVRDGILAGKTEETAAHQQSITEIDQKTAVVQSFKDKLAQPATVKVDFTQAELDAMTFDQRFAAYKRMYSEPAPVGLDTAPAGASLDQLQQKGIKTKADLDAFVGAFAPQAQKAGADLEQGIGTGLEEAGRKMSVWVDGVEVDMSSIAEHGVYGMTSIGESAQKMGETGKAAADGMKSALDEATRDRNMSIEAALKGVDSIKAQIEALTRPETKTITVVTKQVAQKAVGGLVRAFAAGGKLAGYGGGDKIRALLEAGEFVIRKEAVRKYGAAMFNAYNSMMMPSSHVLAFAGGGAVPDVKTGGQSVSLSIPIEINATGSDAGNMERMFRNSIIPQLKEALANNTKSITTTFKKHVS